MIRSVILLVLIAVIAPSARAERVLTLDQALALAEKQNLNLVTAKTRIDVALEGVTVVRAALLPVAQAQGKYTHNYKEVAFQTPTGSNVLQAGEQFDASLNLTVPLFSPAAFPALTSARRTVDATRAEVEVSRATILLSVASAFYAAAGSDELLLARDHAVEVAEVTLKNARERLSVGAVTEVDISRAELALVRAEQARAEAGDAHDRAYRALATALQLREPFRVKKDSGPAGEKASGRGARPEIASLERAIESLDAQISSLGWRWAPTLSAFANARLFNYTGFAGDNYSWAAGLQLDWTLFEGGTRDAERRKTEAKKRETIARLRLQNDTIGDEIADAEGALKTKQRALKASTRAAELAKQTLKLVRVQYDNGASTQLDLLQAQDALVASEVGVAQARFDLALADLSLRRATGQFP